MDERQQRDDEQAARWNGVAGHEVRFTAACWMVEGTAGSREEDAHA